MSASNATTVDFRQIAATLQTRWRSWVIPTVAMTVLALAYALVKPNTWQARQALVVRDEAVGDLSRQGRFDTSYALKTAQETVLEVARHRSVVEAALKSAGPAKQPSKPNWPTPDDIGSLRDAIAVTAPKGAEFGQTEVIYLTVKDKNRARAITLTDVVCDQLERRLQLLRQRKAQSVIDELERTTALARKDLDEATARLQTIEADVGSDLGELRILSEVGAGDSNLRASLNQIKNDLRQAQSSYTANKEQLAILGAARQDETQLIATPSRLLDSQPALRRLKEGLVDAQLRTAALRGSRSVDHPQVREAMAAEDEVRRHLQRELESAIAGLNADLQVNAAQIAALEKQLSEVNARLDRLASLRARYANLQAEVRQRAAQMEKSQQDLATARASQAAAASASLLTRLDVPLADDRPLGPSRASIVLAGLVGGLATGLGLVFLTAPAGRQWGRRWSDYLRNGRRATDGQGRRAGDPAVSGDGEIVLGRRATDPPLASRAELNSPGRRASDAPSRRAEDRRMAPTTSPVTVPAVEAAAPTVRAATAEAKPSLSLTESLSRLVAETRRQG